MRLFLFVVLMSIGSFGQSEIRKAKQWILEQHFSKAQELMEVYVKQHPQDLEGVEVLGDAYGYQEKWDQAIEVYKKLVYASPKTANYHYKFGGALGMKALTVNKLKALAIIGDVRTAFLTAAQLDPNHIDTRWALVELYLQLPGLLGGSQSKALYYANELEQLSKVDGYLAKGHIYQEANDLQQSETYYKRAVAEGGSLVCYQKLINVYKLQKQTDKAMATMETALKIHADHSLNYEIGKIAAENGLQLDKGEKHLLTYQAHHSAKDEVSLAWVNYYLARIYRLQNKKLQALNAIDLALSKGPENSSFQSEKKRILNLR